MRRMISYIVLVVLLAAMLSGCSIKIANTEYHFTTGLSSEELFKIEEEICTVKEAKVIMSAQKKLIEDAYGDAIWSVNTEDVSFSEYVQNSLRDFLTKLKSTKLMAAASNITLSSEEQSQIQACAEEYMKGLTEQETDWLDVTQEEVEQLYEEYYLYNEIVDLMTESEQTEISDSEARIIQVQMIVLSKMQTNDEQTTEKLSDVQQQKKLKTAKSVVNKAKKGTDFEELAKQYSESETIEQSIARGVYGDVFDEIAFNLSDDEISSVIETDEAYYVLKCLNSYDEEATQVHKQEMQNTQKNIIFSNQYQAFVQGLDTQFNNTVWNSLTLEQISVTSKVNFFEIYDKNIK